jgi:hypothetical protein
MTAMLLEREHVTTEEPEQAAHIVMVPPGEDDTTPQAYVLRARIEGFAVTALCGYRWVPQRNPEPLPVCSACLDIYQQPGEHRDEREELPEA